MNHGQRSPRRFGAVSVRAHSFYRDTAAWSAPQRLWRRLLELCNNGATILCVSHNLTQVEEICSRGIFMAVGQVLYNGDTREAIALFNRWAIEKVGALLPKIDAVETTFLLKRGNGDIRLQSLELIDSNGLVKTAFKSGAPLKIRMRLRRSDGFTESTRVWFGFMNPGTMEGVAELGSTQDSLNSSGIEVLFVSGKAVQDIILNPLSLRYGEFGFWVEIKSSVSRNLLAEYTNIRPFAAGGRVQSITPFSARIWHPYVAAPASDSS